MKASNLSGAWGEALAAEYLRKKRYEIVASGFRSRFGEIDLIVQNKRFLVFVEVKLRKNSSVSPPALRKLGSMWITASNPDYETPRQCTLLRIQRICNPGSM